MKRLVAVVLILGGMAWSRTETFYELIYRVLLLVIGVELIRTLVTHDLSAVLELLAFVVARKMLKPELSTLGIVLGPSLLLFCWLQGGSLDLR